MKIGEIIEIKGEKYIAQKEIIGCKRCDIEVHNIDCENKFGCKKDDRVILVAAQVELLRKIEQLEKQIELMKICENCNNAVWESNWMSSICRCKYDNDYCNNYDKWEIADEEI